MCEIKSGDYKTSKVEEQLNNGVELAERICQKYLHSVEYEIIPILMGKGLKGVNGIRLQEPEFT